MRVDPARMAVGAAINDIQDTGSPVAEHQDRRLGHREMADFCRGSGNDGAVVLAASRLGRECRALLGPHAEAAAGAAIDVASEEGTIPAEGHMRIQRMVEYFRATAASPSVTCFSVPPRPQRPCRRP
jgi:hypothetical protein